MVRAHFKPVTPDQRVRDLRKELRGLEKQEAGPERGAQLAELARAAHDERQLNMAMHAAQLCLDDDPDAPALLISAYEDAGQDEVDAEDRLRTYVDLADLARYVDRPDVVEIAQGRLKDTARAWIADGDDQQRRHRLRTLASMVDREFADGLRDELEEDR